jgi:sugar transferase EpsL
MLKRFIDILFLLLLSPIIFIIFIIVWILVRWKIGSPVFFTQTRGGVNGSTFRLWKFRSMKNIYDLHGELLPDSERLTDFGVFIRSTSLDEIPCLYNVLRGEMSLIGPRPLISEYLPLYDSFQSRRHEILPGVTGWAQVNGRNAISWEDKFKLDVWYVDNHSFWLDIRILWLTIKKVLMREDIAPSGQTTLAKFSPKKYKDSGS